MPLDAGANEIAGQTGGVIEVEMLHERDNVYFRRVMATIGDLATATGQTREKLRAQLLVYSGRFELVGDLHGMHVYAVQSMSRHSMKDAELRAFWEDAKQHIVKRVLPLVRNETVRDRLLTAVTSF